MSYLKAFRPREMLKAVYPNPFPGRYPTRIALKIRHDKWAFDYMGKPVAKVGDDFRKLLISGFGQWSRVSYSEFDQQGLIFSQGEGFERSPLSGYVFPLPQVFVDAARSERMYLFLNRKLVKIGKRLMYVIPELFDAERFPTYVAMVQAASKGNLRAPDLRNEERDQAYRTIIKKTEEWAAPPIKPVTPPTQRGVEVSPTAPMTLDVEAVPMPAWNAPPNWLVEGAQTGRWQTATSGVAAAAPTPAPTQVGTPSPIGWVDREIGLNAYSVWANREHRIAATSLEDARRIALRREAEYQARMEVVREQQRRMYEEAERTWTAPPQLDYLERLDNPWEP